MSEGVIKILQKAGFKTVEGMEAVLQKSEELSHGKNTSLCSGFGVFPDGRRCQGCHDCQNKYRKKK